MTKINDVQKLKARLRKGENLKTNPVSAKQAVENLSIAVLNKEDLFLFCASLNYLNAYIKSGGNKKQEVAQLLREEFPKMTFKNGYGFKRFVNVALLAILGNNFDDVTFERFPDQQNLIMITVNGLQFSYHGCFVYNNILPNVLNEEEKFKRGESKKVTGKDWEGLRLQPVAQEVFNFAMDLEGLSGIKYYDVRKPDRPSEGGQQVGEIVADYTPKEDDNKDDNENE